MRQLDPDPSILDALKGYLNVELQNHNAERSALDDRIIAEQKDFWAEPSVGQDELPVVGFASLIIPLTAIAVEAIHARTMGQLYGLKELTTVSVSDKANGIKSDLGKLFDNELMNNIKFKEKTEPAILQLTKHGTGIITTGYREVKTHIVQVDADGKELKVPIYKEKGTTIDGVPVEDYVMPFYATSVEDAPWIGHRFRVSEHNIRQMVASSMLGPEAYMNLTTYYRGINSTSEVLNNQRELTDTEVVYPSEVTLTRVLLDWDVDGNDELSSIEVIYHEDSLQILSLTYSDERNYDKGVYMPLEYRWYGYGIAKMNHEFQVEVTTQHRQRLDNATIANMAMFKVKRRASYIKDDEPIFPGKKWFVEEMDDIEPMFIGDVKASAYNNENQVVIYSQQRMGVNELTLGMPNIGTPGTASDSMARVQESNRKFDYAYNNTKDFLNKVVYRAAQQIIKHGPVQRSVFEILPKGAEIEAFLKNKDVLSNKLLFNIQLAGAKNNKVLDRNTYTQLSGLATQYWTQVLALANQTGDQNLVQEITKKAMGSADGLMLEVLRAWDVPNPEDHIFNFDAYKPAALPAPVADPSQGASMGASPDAGGGITSVVAPNARIDASGGAPQFQLPGASLSLAG